ncbi:hypothetical protein [Vampirovibrio chlorellavorus]|uniref:hypothetical protein n=1 Tax=Vampirovibrio chlorellavorus TaxID=758823 RepID=UPI0026E997D8|nr:hypothetical protein [Vampirovibrio chlorellavorus]
MQTQYLDKPFPKDFGLTSEQVEVVNKKIFSQQNQPLIFSLAWLFGIAFAIYMYLKVQHIVTALVIAGFFGWLPSVVIAVILVYLLGRLEDSILGFYVPHYSSIVQYRKALQAYEAQELKLKNFADRLQKIINDYAAVMEEGGPSLFGCRDISVLPYSKDVIKQALLAGLRQAERIGDLRYKDALIAGYLCLAEYQSGIKSDREVNWNTFENTPTGRTELFKALEGAKKFKDAEIIERETN